MLVLSFVIIREPFSYHVFSYHLRSWFPFSKVAIAFCSKMTSEALIIKSVLQSEKGKEAKEEKMLSPR